MSPLDVDPATGADGIEVALARGGAIEGRVRTAPGREPAGTVVAIDRCDGKPRTFRTGPDGLFRFENLTPGRWNVTRAEREVREGSWSTSWSAGRKTRVEYPSNCTVADGATTRFDLDLTDERPSVLVADVRVNGAPAEGWTATLTPDVGGTGRSHPGGAVDAVGRLWIEAPEEGEYELELGPPNAPEGTVRFRRMVTLRRGENPLEIAFGVGSVRGTLESPAADAVVKYACAPANARELTCEASVRPDPDGRFELPIAMAGHGRVLRMQVLENGGTRGPVAEVQVDVPAGAAVEVTIP